MPDKARSRFGEGAHGTSLWTVAQVTRAGTGRLPRFDIQIKVDGGEVPTPAESLRLDSPEITKTLAPEYVKALRSQGIHFVSAVFGVGRTWYESTDDLVAQLATLLDFTPDKALQHIQAARAGTSTAKAHTCCYCGKFMRKSRWKAGYCERVPCVMLAELKVVPVH